MSRTYLVEDGGSPFVRIPGSTPAPVQVWETDPSTGRRTPTNRQETDEQGTPLWDLQVVARLSVWGRVQPEVVTLRTASPLLPTLSAFGLEEGTE